MIASFKVTVASLDGHHSDLGSKVKKFKVTREKIIIIEMEV